MRRTKNIQTYGYINIQYACILNGRRKILYLYKTAYQHKYTIL